LKIVAFIYTYTYQLDKKMEGLKDEEEEEKFKMKGRKDIHNCVEKRELLIGCFFLFFFHLI